MRMLPDHVYGFFLSVMLLLSAVNGNDCPQSFKCASLGDISFPFTIAERPDCGALAIHRCGSVDNQHQQFQFIIIAGKRFQVRKFVSWPWPTVYIFHEDLNKLLNSSICKVFKHNITLPPTSPLGSFIIDKNITMFQCDRNLSVSTPKTFLKNTSCQYDIFFSPPNSDDVSLSSLANCSTVQLPTNGLPISENLFSFLTAEIPITLEPSNECAQCLHGHFDERQEPPGRCFLDSQKQFYCGIRMDRRSAWRRGLMLAASSVVVVVVLLLLLACCLKRKLLALTIRADETIIEYFLEQHGSLPARRYNYSEIKKYTNHFNVKLGQGGYGSVYKGRLPDGRLVAVKVLSELKGTGEEFINEVASISRTSHVNIVTLVGFCFQGSKRALIYEFMPNGSLEKFIYEEDSAIAGRQLDCKTLYDIVIGVARGLDYLHRGCNTKILHFDIKPHNILLDEDFCPKISDFGLAKICSRKESTVSMMCARGTIGYIAPEVFSRNFGGVSHKADVYSYGMMILEMVGGKHNKNVQVDCSSELYFPHWIYKRLEQDQDFGLLCIKNESDREIVRRMVVVSLWCIQTTPSSRPSMNTVVEMLEESLGSLTLPPPPFLDSSPPSMTHHSSQTLETTL